MLTAPVLLPAGAALVGAGAAVAPAVLSPTGAELVMLLLGVVAVASAVLVVTTRQIRAPMKQAKQVSCSQHLAIKFTMLSAKHPVPFLRATLKDGPRLAVCLEA